MSDTIILTARTSPIEREASVQTRSPERSDIPGISQLYFDAYDQQQSIGSRQAAHEVISDAFAGKYGTLLLDASRVITDDDGHIIAGVLVVEGAPSNDAPSAPFLVELFTDPERRREGLAVHLVRAASEQLFNAGYSEVAVKIDESNIAALALYLSLDFRRWDGETAE